MDYRNATPGGARDVSYLNRHPFAVEAYFEKSLVLAYAVPGEILQPLIPDCLELDLFQKRWGFVALAMVRTRALRPAGFPKLLGRDFTLVGYRAFVRHRGEDGRRRRGLYILGSETNRSSMAFLGNIFTRYLYSTVGIDWTSSESGEENVRSANGLEVEACAKRTGEAADPALPDASPFADWKEARRFAGPMPFTFSVEEQSGNVVIVEGVRSSWKPQPMSVRSAHVPFFENHPTFDFSQAVLANAFLVEGVPYRWERGLVQATQTEEGA